jgi:preprotein translocase subunit SecE
VTEDRDQDRAAERDNAARPSTAAARRERRAASRGDARPSSDRVEDKVPVAVGAGTRRARPADADRAPTSKAAQGIATPKRDRGDKRPSVFARLAKFIREVISELRKVIWPTRKQQITYTIVVLVFVAFVVALVSGLDILFDKGVFWIFA